MKFLKVCKFVAGLSLFGLCLDGLAACGDNNPVTAGPNIVFVTTSSATTVAATTVAVTATTQAAAANPPANVPGGKIVYDSGDSQIFVINPDGSSQAKVVNGASPLFAPDGKRLAFVSTQGQATDPNGLKATIETIKLDGTDRQDSCPAKANNRASLVSWSPKGKFIAFQSGPANADGIGAMYLCTVASSSVAKESLTVTQGDVLLAYDWSPGGDYTVWQSARGKGPVKLYYGDPDKGGKDATTLADDQNGVKLLGDQKFYLKTSISPDGKSVMAVGAKIFFMNVPDQKSPLDGKNLDGLNKPINAAWSPDNQWLAVIDQTGDTRSLKLVEIATGKSYKLADNVGSGVDWSK